MKERVKESSSSSGSLASSGSCLQRSDSPPLQRKYSRSHQKRFHRRFPAIDSNEKLIKWYSCALKADILLQGYLYVSESYFAFYSNIFGYKTQLLIPICDVISVTKQRTAKIFPNAVGVCTEDSKYVFGSLLSREATFRVMQEVWRNHLDVNGCFNSPTETLHVMETSSPTSGVPNDQIESFNSYAINSRLSEDEESLARFSICEAAALPNCFPSETTVAQDASGSETKGRVDHIPGRRQSLVNLWKHKCQSIKGVTTTTYLLLVSTALLLLLLLSASILLYRAYDVHYRLEKSARIPLMKSKGHYTEVQLTEQYLTEEMQRMMSLLQVKLSEVAKVRRSLEELYHSFQRLPNDCPH